MTNKATGFILTNKVALSHSQHIKPQQLSLCYLPKLLFSLVSHFLVSLATSTHPITLDLCVYIGNAST